MEDDSIIFFEESNVLDTKDDVIVYEERYKSDANIVLSKDQITNELTNLFLNKYKLAAAHKIEALNQCFEDLTQKSDLTDYMKYTMHPVIKCQKLKIESDALADKELQEQYYFKSQNLSAFVNQFERLCESSDTYVNTSTALYNLHRPFTTTTETVVPPYNIDAYRHLVTDEYDDSELEKLDIDKYHQFRLVGPVKIDTGKRPETQTATAKGCPSGMHYISTSNTITLYDGDKVDIVGYLNVPPDMSPTTYEIQVFDASEYRKSLQQFKKDDKVRVYFNDFVFDRENALVTEINAIATGPNEIKFPKHLTLNGEEFMITSATNSAFHVYLRNDKRVKYRNSYLKKRVLFFTEPLELTLSELIYLNGPGTTHPFKVLQEKKYAQTLAYLTRPIEQPVIVAKKRKTPPPSLFSDYLDFEKNAFAIKVYRDAPQLDKVDTELTRALYLQSKNDYGRMYALLLLKKRLVEKIKTFNKSGIEKRIAELKKEAIKRSSDNKSSQEKITIAKKYESFEKMQAHNQGLRRIYFDKDIDPTKYHLLNSISSAMSDDEKRVALLQELIKEKEPEFEADAIIKGKRLVRQGDYAIYNGILYVRKKVDDIMLWIKTIQMPFEQCGNISLVKFEELNDAITLDPFDLLCKKMQDIKQDYVYDLYNTELIKLQNIIALIDNKETILASIDNSIVEHYKLFELCDEDTSGLTGLRIPSNIKIELKDADQQDKYAGNIDFFDIDAVYNNLDFSENPGHGIMAKTTGLKEELNLENIDILRAFTDTMGLSLDDDIIIYILTQANDKYPKSKVQEMVDNKVRTDVAKNPNLRNDPKYKKTIAMFKIDVIKNHNKNIILYVGALLAITLMIKFPQYSVRKIVPKCNKAFSQQNLTNYIACLLTYLGTPGDLQFHQFTQISTQQLENTLKQVVTDILDNNHQLRQSLESNKENLKANVAVKAADWSDFMKLNLTFKPDFNFDKAVSIPYINYVKDLNSQDITALVKLSNTIAFYTGFKDEADTKKDVETVMYYPPSKKIKASKTPFKDITKTFSKINIQLHEEEFDIIKETFLALPFNPLKTYDYDDESWWEDNLYKTLNEMFAVVETILGDVGLVKALIITMETDDFTTEKLVNLRSTLYNFLKFKLRSILARIVYKDPNIQVIIGDSPFDVKLLEQSIPDVEPFYIESDELVKNIGILAFILVLTLKNIKDKQPNTFAIKVSKHVMEELNKYLMLNDINSDKINSKMEELRELKKQKLIAEYSKDDETRKLQIALKKMGISKVVEKPKDTKDPNQYAGENPDENEVE